MQPDLLQKLKLSPFVHLPWLSNGYKQTIASYLFPYNPFLLDEKVHFIRLADGDTINVVENRPLNVQNSQRIILLIHGLTGSHRSKYIVRITQKLLQQGFITLRMNLRGCGLGQGLAKHLYHSGRSEDVRAVLAYFAQVYPQQKITTVGFSLGGNIVLKMAGENHSIPQNCDSVAAISPPINLYHSVKLIIHKNNKLFNDHFMRALIKDAEIRQRHFPDIQAPSVSKMRNVYDFDNLYTAPLSGFENANDYYERSSSQQFMANITLPTFLLYSLDDPVISRRDFFNLPNKENFDFLITNKGGHVAWLGYTPEKGHFRWMDKAVVAWIKWFNEQQ